MSKLKREQRRWKENSQERMPAGYQKKKTRNQKTKKTNNYISYFGQDLPTRAYFVFNQGCSRTKNTLHRQHLVQPSSRVSVQCCGRAMWVGIIGGAVMGHRVALPACPVSSQLALGVLLLFLAVVGVCTGVLSAEFVC